MKNILRAPWRLVKRPVPWYEQFCYWIRRMGSRENYFIVDRDGREYKDDVFNQSMLREIFRAVNNQNETVYVLKQMKDFLERNPAPNPSPNPLDLPPSDAIARKIEALLGRIEKETIPSPVETETPSLSLSANTSLSRAETNSNV